MSAVIVEILVHEGQIVKTGDPLVRCSAMKMESLVSSQVGGEVKKISVLVGDSCVPPLARALLTLSQARTGRPDHADREAPSRVRSPGLGGVMIGF